MYCVQKGVCSGCGREGEGIFSVLEFPLPLLRRYERRGWVTYKNDTDVREACARLTTNKVELSVFCECVYVCQQGRWEFSNGQNV